MSKLYGALGVSQDASADDIRKAYRKLAMKMHPDKGGDEEKFKELSQAYEVLSDDKQRAMYDQLGDERYNEVANGGGPSEHPSPHDMFQQMFTNFGGFGFGFPGGPGGPGGPVRRNDHQHNIAISMDQAFHGTQKTIKINVRKTCFSCQSACNTCQGRGVITDMQRMGIFTTTSQRVCHVCQGCGKQTKKNTGCSSCKGSGSTQSEIVHDLKIPPGVNPKFHIRLQGLGEQAQNDGDIPGDMIIHVIVEDHHLFTRTGHKGKDLVFKQAISLVDSIVGTEIVVPHFAGEIRVDTGTFGVIVPGKHYIVKEKGMPGGDLYLEFSVTYPNTTLKDNERTILKDAFQRCASLRRP